MTIPGCPSEYVPEEVWELLSAADLIEKTGTWPRGAGWANEPAALVDGVRRVWQEFATVKAELQRRAHGR